MTRTRTLVMLLLAAAALGLAALAAFFAIGWLSLPKGQRDYMAGRKTEAAAQVQAQIDAARAEPDSVRAPAAVAPPGHIQVISPSSIDLTVEAGGTVSTPCFEFKAAMKSRVTGDGCRVSVAATSEGNSAVGYFTAEILSDDPPGTDVGPMARMMLDSIGQAAAQAGTYRGENPAPYDTDFGRYLGQRNGVLAGLTAVELRWGLLRQKDVVTVTAGADCSPDARGDCAAGPGLQANRSVKYNGLAALPADRYVWGGRPQAWLLVTGWEKGFHWRGFDAARASLHLR